MHALHALCIHVPCGMRLRGARPACAACERGAPVSVRVRACAQPPGSLPARAQRTGRGTRACTARPLYARVVWHAAVGRAPRLRCVRALCCSERAGACVHAGAKARKDSEAAVQAPIPASLDAATMSTGCGGGGGEPSTGAGGGAAGGDSFADGVASGAHRAAAAAADSGRGSLQSGGRTSGNGRRGRARAGGRGRGGGSRGRGARLLPEIDQRWTEEDQRVWDEEANDMLQIN